MTKDAHETGNGAAARVLVLGGRDRTMTLGLTIGAFAFFVLLYLLPKLLSGEIFGLGFSLFMATSMLIVAGYSQTVRFDLDTNRITMRWTIFDIGRTRHYDLRDFDRVEVTKVVRQEGWRGMAYMESHSTSHKIWLEGRLEIAIGTGSIESAPTQAREIANFNGFTFDESAEIRESY